MENLVRVNDNNFDRLQARRGLTVKNNSQMSKVGDLGLGIEAAERQDAAARAKLEARITSINSLDRQLQELGVVVATFGLKSKSNQILTLTAALETLDQIRAQPELPIGAAKPLRMIRNAMVSVREGLMTGAYTKSERAGLEIHEIIEARAALSQMKTKATDRLELMASVKAPAHEINDNDVKALQTTATAKGALDAIRSRPNVLCMAPIIPVLAGRLDLNKLRAAGVRCEMVGGYPMIYDQRVIGVNKDAIQADARGKPERAIEAATRYMVSLREAVAPLTMVAARAVAHAGGSWYWVADRGTLRALQQAAGGNINVTDWGFGFGG